MIECAIWWSTPLPNEARYRDLLDPHELHRYAAYRKDSDRLRFLTGRVLAKTMVGEQLELSPATVIFDASCEDCGKQHGPPRVPGSHLSLSISHSGDRIGVALANGAPVGLDVESTTRRVDDALISYALNAEEARGIKNLTPELKANAFFTYWTRKEALMKATGKGLRIPLSAITVSSSQTEAKLVNSTDPALDPASTQLADLDPGAGYRAAIAVLSAEEITTTEHWSKANDLAS